MILDRAAAIDRIRKPRHFRDLERARKQESRLKFHAQITDTPFYNKDFQDETWLRDRYTGEPMNYYFQFLWWAKSILTAKDKFIQFANLLTFPIQTNDLIDTIADEYQKVFNAQDSYRGLKFKDSQQLSDYLNYLEEQKDTDFWRSHVFNSMLTAINSIIVVDLEAEQTGETPEPYYYLLSIDRVIDVECGPDGKIEYLIFRDRENNIVVLDDANYTVYLEKAGDDDAKYRKHIQSPHPLGYTPAKWMWHDSLDQKNPYIKQSPISSIQSRLDWFLFLTTSKQCLDIYASFPIYWHYKDKCEVKECKSGVIPYMMGDGVTQGYRACPACEKNSLVGAGSVLRKPAPRPGESDNIGVPAGVIPAETDSLTYNVDEVERIKQELIELATGKVLGPTKQQLNEKQVESQYESQSNILRYIGENLAIAQKWVYETTARLIYGEAFIGCDINNGTKFYLQTQGEVTAEYRDCREAGLPIYILQAQRNQITELQAKNNPTEKERLEILKYLEPYQDSTIEELKNLGIELTDPEGFVLKLNFSSFVNRFELEYGNIVEWGSALDLKTKISRINQVLTGYGQKPPQAAQLGAAESAA